MSGGNVLLVVAAVGAVGAAAAFAVFGFSPPPASVPEVTAEPIQRSTKAPPEPRTVVVPAPVISPQQPGAAVDVDKNVSDPPQIVLAPQWKPTTREEQLRVQIAEQPGKPTRQQQIDLLGVCVPGLPGVTPTNLPMGDTGWCGTSCLMRYHSIKDQLTPAQLAVAKKHFGE